MRDDRQVTSHFTEVTKYIHLVTRFLNNEKPRTLENQGIRDFQRTEKEGFEPSRRSHDLHP